MNVNQERLFRHLTELGEIGRKADGLHCLALSSEENEVHHLTRRYMEEAGLQVRVDAAGNLFGRKEGTDPSAPVVMTGSHLDTVYGGGIFDGRLGVLAGIEALQTLNENGIQTKNPLEVVAYRDEEGTRFMGPFSGAAHMAGKPPAGILDHVDRDGITVRDALLACGIDPEHVQDAALPKDYAKAHLELHIEQGAVLENLGLAVGVVTGICCQIRGEYTIVGQSAHAGTTPIALRHDALCAAAEVILAIEEEAAKDTGSVATVGRITVEPGGVNVVPGVAKFSLDLRNLSLAARDALFARVDARAKEICDRRKVTVSFETLVKETVPHPCDEQVQKVICDACEKLGYPVHKMPSGAGHDTCALTDFCPTGMIFIRSKDGLSHNGAEYSSPEDCAAGAEVLMESMLTLASND